MISFSGGQGGDCNECDGGRPKVLSNGLNQKFRKSKQRSQKKSHDVLKAKYIYVLFFYYTLICSFENI